MPSSCDFKSVLDNKVMKAGNDKTELYTQHEVPLQTVILLICTNEVTSD